MCGFPALDVASMDQSIPKEMWGRWDGLQTQTPVQPEQSLSTANVNYDSDSTIAYDLEEVMNMGYESNSNHSDNIPSSIDEVIRAITPVAWLDNPLPRPQVIINQHPLCTAQITVQSKLTVMRRRWSLEQAWHLPH